MRILTRSSVTLLIALTCAPGILGAQSLEIWQIQGAGMSSPYAGQRVTTENDIVTAVGPHGFFIETPPDRTDGNPQTSDGIYVYTNVTPTVHAGDLVDVTGTVSEYHELTEIGSSPEITVAGAGTPLPPPIELDAHHPSPNRPQPANELERYEGMLVHVASGVVTGPTDRYGNFTIVARTTRAFREPGIAFPGLPGLPVWDGNPEVLEVDPGALGLPEQEVAAGSPVRNMTGVLSFSFGRYQIWPVVLGVTQTSPLAPVRPRVPGEVTVATQNLERFFDDVDDPETDDTVLTSAELETRLAKASTWIRRVLGSPDILALEEVENLDVLQALSEKIEADDPSVHYTPYLIPGNDFSGMNVAFFVRSSITVDQLTQLDADDTFNSGGRTYATFDRPPLMLRCRASTGGAPFPLTVIAVHLRSLNGIDDPDKGEFVRHKRFLEALDLSHDIQHLQQGEPNIHLVVLGDFNAFGFSDGYVDVMGQVTGRIDPLGAMLPATPVVSPPLTDEAGLLPQGERYTFVNGGSADDLDHVLVSTALAPWVRGLCPGRGDADAPVGLSADPSTPLRTSDHDGLELYLMTDRNGNGIPDDREPPEKAVRGPARGRVRGGGTPELQSRSRSLGLLTLRQAAAR
ncbi:MAG: hypothetical protein GXP48_05810 [Acidobacteria bacterium]|nr:hypothetical protein [Acidobacteriota bacterium]